VRGYREPEPPKPFLRKGSPFYQYDFEIERNRFQGSTKQRDQEEAQKIVTQKWQDGIRQIEEAKKTGNEPMRLKTAAKRWWDEVGAFGAEQDLGPYSTDPNDAHLPINWLVAQLGPETFLHDIKDRHVAAIVNLRRNKLIQRGRDEKGKLVYRPISNRTVNRTVTKLLRRIINKAVKKWNGIIYKQVNWSEHVLEEKRNIPRVIKFDEEPILEAHERDELRDYREFILESGLRLREGIITWFQVDFLEGVIKLTQKGHKPRMVAITPRLEALLRRQEGRHETMVWTFVARKTRCCPHSGIKFIRGQRYPLTAAGITSARKRDWAKAGININMHDVRRTAASRMRAFVGLGAAQDLLGHDSSKTTELYIGEVDPNLMRKQMMQRAAAEEKMREEIEQSRKTPRTNPHRGV